MHPLSDQSANEQDKRKNESNNEIKESGNHGLMVHSSYSKGGSSTPPASNSPCCIFKIPECLTRNRYSLYGYQPIRVSIGPYHNGNQQLKGMEGRKEELRKSLESKCIVGQHLVEAVKEKIDDIRKSYFDLPKVGDDDSLVNMMVLDGCFLLTLFLKASGHVQVENSIFSMPWALPAICRDLLLLENQIPLFVLEILLKIIHPESDLNKIALNFLSPSFKKDQDWVEKHSNRNLKATHLLDLICQTYTPVQPQTDNLPVQPQTNNPPVQPQTDNPPVQPQTDNSPVQPQTDNNSPVQPQTDNPPVEPQTDNPPIQPQTDNPPVQPQTANLPGLESDKNSSSKPNFLKLKLSTKELCNRGVKFELKNDVDTFLAISFENGVLKIPEIILDDFISVVLLNCVAFEQFYASTTHITSYVVFMGCLINSERDATYLVEKGIVQNYLGMDDEVSLFFKNILKDYAFDIEKNTLADLMKEVDDYSSNWYHVMWTNCKQFYMGSPWICLSTVAALTLLLLTVAQVVMAAIAL